MTCIDDMQMNYDWLFRAQPIKMWFEGKGGIFDVSAFHWFICYSGCAFDLVVRTCRPLP